MSRINGGLNKCTGSRAEPEGSAAERLRTGRFVFFCDNKIKSGFSTSYTIGMQAAVVSKLSFFVISFCRPSDYNRNIVCVKAVFQVYSTIRTTLIPERGNTKTEVGQTNNSLEKSGYERLASRRQPL
jgi:hypothetical protein